MTPTPTTQPSTRRPSPPRKRIPLVLAKLRDARLRANLTQETLARQLGYALSTLAYWEQFGRSPQLINLINWADALGYEITIKKKAKS